MLGTKPGSSASEKQPLLTAESSLMYNVGARSVSSEGHRNEGLLLALPGRRPSSLGLPSTRITATEPLYLVKSIQFLNFVGRGGKVVVRQGLTTDSRLSWNSVD